ncbi:MAG: ABC-F family ATP-binding cassette domain-containing protein [Acidaminococcales bacterium]|nr:ABC-F family ATP-binding cassette domain-containing protein [Acidaminococcales bacterium]
MSILAENLTKCFGGKEIFRQVNLRLEKGAKIGLIGNNGAGKTTLMRCILGLDEYDGGRVFSDPAAKIGYAAQDARPADGSLWEELTASRQELFALSRQIRDLEGQIGGQPDERARGKLLARYSDLRQDYERQGGYDHELKARKAAFVLGFSDEDLRRRAKDFSGGQKTRMLLAAALLGEPDFLFLDEPTNHLDIAMAEWLEGYLREFKGGLLLVSHDRYFLDRTVDKIALLEAGRVKIYKGNYSLYEKQKETEDKTQAAAWEKQAAHIKKTEEYIRRNKAGIKSRQARGRQAQLDRLERVAPASPSDGLKLKLPVPPECSDRLLTLEKLTVGYGCPLLKDIDFTIQKGEKIAVIGRNGAGKTTLLRTIAGILPALSGRVTAGGRVKVGYFSQGHEGLSGGENILENILAGFGLSEEQARTFLGGMLFRGGDVFKKLEDLSGGERARLALLRLLLGGANFLLLDEPTNHLDAAARAAVEEALRQWGGGMLLVSHDRYFIDRIAGRVWEIEGGRLFDYPGNYSYCREQKNARPKDMPPPALARAAAKTVKESPKTRSVERRLAAVELSLREQEGLLLVLEKRLSDPAEHADFAASRALSTEYARQKAGIDSLTAEWETLLTEWENR